MGKYTLLVAAASALGLAGGYVAYAFWLGAESRSAEHERYHAAHLPERESGPIAGRKPGVFRLPAEGRVGLPVASLSTHNPVREDENAPDSPVLEEATSPGSAPVELVAYTLESAFRSEPAGGRDSHSDETSLWDSLKPLLRGHSTLESVECKASMCRLVSAQDDMESYTEFVQQATRSGMCGECFWTKTGDTEDGRPILTVFVAREGAQLPRVD